MRSMEGNMRIGELLGNSGGILSEILQFTFFVLSLPLKILWTLGYALSSINIFVLRTLEHGLTIRSPFFRFSYFVLSFPLFCFVLLSRTISKTIRSFLWWVLKSGYE